MFVVTGITGKVGAAVARGLLAADQPVRAVVRDRSRSTPWAQLGCDIAVADLSDTEGRKVLGRMESALGSLLMPVAFLRAAWFMENAAWDIDSARSGLIRSYLQPLDRAVPMVSTDDVGRTAAALLQERWEGKRVVELEGPQRVSPNAMAAAFIKALGTQVRAEVVPREQWESIFSAQGMKNPTPRIQMIEGFNAGWIDFADRGAHARTGSISIDQAITTLIQRQRA